MRKKAARNKNELTTYSAGNVRNIAHLRELYFWLVSEPCIWCFKPFCRNGTRTLKFPPITVMIKRYRAIEDVRMTVGARSTIIAEVTPTHISPMTFDGIRVRKHQGAGRKRAPAANGAASN